MLDPIKADTLKAAIDAPANTVAAVANFPMLHMMYRESLTSIQLRNIADVLGVSTGSLMDMGLGWSAAHHVYTVPVYDSDWHIVGIYTRDNEGNKKLLPGSTSGLFLPNSFRSKPGVTFVAEGMSDTAALATIGLNVVGRYNAGCNVECLVKLLACHTTYIIADTGAAGERGAKELGIALNCAGVIHMPSGTTPIKDVRDLLCTGGRSITLRYILSEVAKYATKH